MCSPRRLASGKFSVAYYFFTTSNPHKINGSRTFITLSRWLFLVIMFTSFVVLIVRLLQITDNSQLSSDPPAKLGRSVHSLTSPFDHRTMHKHLYTTPLVSLPRAWISILTLVLLLSISWTTLPVLNNVCFRLNNKVKRLQLKLARYKWHETDQTYYYKHSSPKTRNDQIS